jgi:ABC-type multidrug transport system permease subunit
MREAFREPEVIFWVFIFPVLLALVLGIAFRNKPPDRIHVAIENRPEAKQIVSVLNRSDQFDTEILSAADSASRLRLGKVALVIVPVGGANRSLIYEYRYDPTRPDSALARILVDDALQEAAGRRDPAQRIDKPVSEPGARYIDFLIPGLIGMNLMSGGMWGLGFVIVDMRSRKLLKRLVASPMRRSEFLAAMMASRIVFMLIQVILLLAFGSLVFDLVIRGSILATLTIGFLGALSFGSMGLLVASRAAKIEAVSGLMNLVMFPMFVFSGVFFSSDRFPDVLQPFIKALPLTLLNDAFRAVILEGADFHTQSLRLLALGLWGVVCYVLALRIFRWS